MSARSILRRTKGNSKNDDKTKDKSENHPYVIFKNAMKEETNREKRRDEKKKQRDEKRNNNKERHDDIPALVVMKQSFCEVLMKPKDSMSAYDFFVQHSNAKSKYVYLNPQQLKQKWKRMSNEEKVQYLNLAIDDRMRYQYEIKVYKESLKQEGYQDTVDEVKPRKVKKGFRLKRNSSQ